MKKNREKKNKNKKSSRYALEHEQMNQETKTAQQQPQIIKIILTLMSTDSYLYLLCINWLGIIKNSFIFMAD